MASTTAHLVPGWKFTRQHIEDGSIDKPVLLAQKSLLQQIARSSRSCMEKSPIVGFLHDNSSIRSTFHTISQCQECNKVTVVVHGSGGAVAFGYEEDAQSRFRVTAQQLASTLAGHLKAIGVTVDVQIDLMFCNSATRVTCWEGGGKKREKERRRYNFAQDLSASLCHIGLPDTFVCGYTGFIIEKGNAKAANGKFSCVNSLCDEAFRSHHSDFQHCALPDARATYLEGRLFEEAKHRLKTMHPGLALGP